MKCVCGYESESEFPHEMYKDRKFIMTTKTDYAKLSKQIEKTKTIYACPKCGTLKIELTEQEEI